MKAEDVKLVLQKSASPTRAKNSVRFFKTGPGQYSENDQFIGITVPEQRKIAANFNHLPLPEVVKLLQSKVHEYRLTALFILIDQYRRSDKETKKRISDLYYENRFYVNNWDLVDGSAPYILGDYLTSHSPKVLLTLARSKSIWDRRIAIVSTFAWIKDNQFDPTIQIAVLLLGDKEDLIHKAVGWALREVGKKDLKTLLNFLDQYAGSMPRTSLRYSLERLTSEQQRHFMSSQFKSKT